MNDSIAKRHFLCTLSAGTLLATTGPALECSAGENQSRSSPAGPAAALREVRLERRRPLEIEQAMQACPVLFQPLIAPWPE